MLKKLILKSALSSALAALILCAVSGAALFCAFGITSERNIQKLLLFIIISGFSVLFIIAATGIIIKIVRFIKSINSLDEFEREKIIYELSHNDKFGDAYFTSSYMLIIQSKATHFEAGFIKSNQIKNIKPVKTAYSDNSNKCLEIILTNGRNYRFYLPSGESLQSFYKKVYSFINGKSIPDTYKPLSNSEVNSVGTDQKKNSPLISMFLILILCIFYLIGMLGIMQLPDLLNGLPEKNIKLIYSASAIIWCIGVAAGIIILGIIRIIKIFKYKTYILAGSSKAIPFILMMGFFILWFGIMFLIDTNMFEMFAESF